MLSRSLLPALAALSSLATASNSGKATFYGGNTSGGMCSFSTYTIPSGIYGTALSDSNWDNSAACGGCMDVTYNGKTITAMVVDQCPGCGENHLDLFEDAFEAIDSNTSDGEIDVTWEWVECPITSALEIHMKSGVSANWFSAQVVNANKRVASMSVSTDGGSTWQTDLTRQDYNFFEQSAGFGSTTVAIKVESEDGDQVTVKGCDVSSDGSTTGSGNF